MLLRIVKWMDIMHRRLNTSKSLLHSCSFLTLERISIRGEVVSENAQKNTNIRSGYSIREANSSVSLANAINVLSCFELMPQLYQMRKRVILAKKRDDKFSTNSVKHHCQHKNCFHGRKR